MITSQQYSPYGPSLPQQVLDRVSGVFLDKSRLENCQMIWSYKSRLIKRLTCSIPKMYGQAKVCYSQNRFPSIFACIYHKNMNIFSMCWRCLKQVNIAGLRSTAPFSTWLLSSTIIDTSWKFCYNHKLKVLLQITSWKFCYKSQAESSATIDKLKVLLQSQAESFATIHTSWKCWKTRWVRDDCFVGEKTFLFSNEKGFLHVCSHCPYQSMT